MSEGLAQGPNMATRVEFEPETLWMQGTEPTQPPCPLALVKVVIQGYSRPSPGWKGQP